eukprot:m.350850 g.350850  ORF g.350850 m.350850 type:complete len:65 (+) comp16160_c0_seq7:1874-2068(+)
MQSFLQFLCLARKLPVVCGVNASLLGRNKAMFMRPKENLLVILHGSNLVQTLPLDVFFNILKWG